MIRTRYISVLFCLFLFLPSCRQKQEYDVDNIILEVSDIEVDGDVEVGDVTFDVRVSSNVSWSARPDSKANWLIVEGGEHVNPTGVLEDGFIHLKFMRNESAEPRNAIIQLFAEGLVKKVSVVQKGRVPRLRAECAGNGIVEAEPQEPQLLNILSNTVWRVSLDESSTSSVELSATSGQGDGAIKLTFSPNYDCTVEKTAVINFDAYGVERQQLVIRQSANVPFVRFLNQSSKTEVNPNAESAKIAIRANSHWTATILEGASLDSLSLDKVEGGSGWITVTPSFSKNESDFTHTATIRFALTEHPEVYTDVLLSQKSGRVIELYFNQGSEDWSPALPSVLKQTFSGEYRYLPYNYSLCFHVKEGDAFCLFDKTSLCFSIGSKAISWIELPCPEGLRLSSLSIHSTNAAGSQSFTIYDYIDKAGNCGSALAPRVKISHTEGSSSIASWGDGTPWTTAPGIGQTVYLYQSKQTNAKIDNLILIFTK